MDGDGALGGKANGLNLLAQNTDLGFRVLDFEVIDAFHYDDFLKQRELAHLSALLLQRDHPQEKTVGVVERVPKRLEDRCFELSQKFGGLNVAVRSSGTIFEDNQQFSGAGIYDSIIIDTNNLTTSALREAVLKVYSSIQNPRAVSYRHEKGLAEERMAVVVQEFLEPTWSGVMYTSNPTYPQDISIEFNTGRNKVVEGIAGSHIVDYNKRTGKRVFESERLPNRMPFDLDKLAQIGIALEKRIGPSDIEFLVDDGEFYFIQRRSITDIQEPKRIKIPKYEPEQFIVSSNLKRGTGKVKLPVVKLSDINDFMDRLQLLNMIDPREAGRQVKEYFRNIIRNDSEFASGYILLLPHFHQTAMPIFALHTMGLGINGDPTYDNLTPHKRAIITTRVASISSHVMTVARERGIPYVGFGEKDDLFSRVQTGDVLSIYFQGREAKIFLEDSPLRSIHQTNPQVSFEIRHLERGYVAVTTSAFLDSTKPYTNDFLLFLKTATGQDWKFEPFDGIMGGAYVNPEGRHVLMSMAQARGQYHSWSFNPPSICRRMGYTPLSEKRLLPLIQQYIEHLNSSQ